MTQKNDCKKCKHICKECRYFDVKNPDGTFRCDPIYECHAVQKTEINCVTGEEELTYGNPEVLNKTGCCTKYKKLVSLTILPLLEELKKEYKYYHSNERENIAGTIIQQLIEELDASQKTVMDIAKQILEAASSFYSGQSSYDCDSREDGPWNLIQNALKALENSNESK